MNKLFVPLAAALFIAGSVSSVSSALWRNDSTQRLAVSHDGNCYDIDDVGASAFVWAICWSFGAVNKVCHFEHSNNLAGCSGTNSQYLEMIASSEGGATHFGLGAGTGYGQVGIVRVSGKAEVRQNGSRSITSILKTEKPRPTGTGSTPDRR